MDCNSNLLDETISRPIANADSAMKENSLQSQTNVNQVYILTSANASQNNNTKSKHMFKVQTFNNFLQQIYGKCISSITFKHN